MKIFNHCQHMKSHFVGSIQVVIDGQLILTDEQIKEGATKTGYNSE